MIKRIKLYPCGCSDPDSRFSKNHPEGMIYGVDEEFEDRVIKRVAFLTEKSVKEKYGTEVEIFDTLSSIKFCPICLGELLKKKTT